MLRCTLLSSLIFVASLYAQDPRGNIVGRVTDKTEAVVPDIEVRARTPATGVVAVGRTTSAGDYRISFLLPGTYTVSAETRGFKKFVRQNVEVRVTETVEVSFAMEVGNVTETVQVTAETPSSIPRRLPGHRRRGHRSPGTASPRRQSRRIRAPRSRHYE